MIYVIVLLKFILPELYYHPDWFCSGIALAFVIQPQVHQT